MRRHATVTTAVLVLLLAGSVSAQEKTEPIRYSPKEIRMELSPEEAQVSGGRHWGKIMILDGKEGQLRLTGLQTSPNLMAMVYDLIHRFPGGASIHAFRVETRLKPVERIGIFEEWVKLSTNCPEAATIRVPVTYRVCSNVRAIPKALLINRFLDQEASKKIRLRTVAAVDLEVERVSTGASWLAVRSSRVDPNTVDLEVSLAPEGLAAKEVLQATLTARVTRPEKCEMTVPIVLLPLVALGNPAVLSVIARANQLNVEQLGSFRCRYTTKSRSVNGRELNQLHEYAFAGSREYHRVENIGAERPQWYLYVKNDGQAYALIPGLLDLVAHRQQGLFETAAGTGAGVIASLDQLDRRYDRVVATREATCEGRRCVAVDVEQYLATSSGERPDCVLTIWFSVEDGFLPVRVDSKPPEDADKTDSWVYRTRVTKILKHRVQGGTFYLPAAYHQEAYRGGKLARTDEGGIEEESVEIDAALPSELFRLEAQPGEMVVDRGLVSTPSQTPVQLSIPGIRDFFGARTSFTSERGDSMEVKVVFGQELERFWGMSLCGGPLPGWDGIQLDRKSIENQAVLVCFWDMNQRPSRRCLDVLAAQGEALKQKGVVVISVQVAPVEEGTLQAWLKEHGVPGVVGMVRGEVEKLRSAWAVPSLPWLILADRRHVVRAEGFSADTLTEVLSTLSTP